MESASDFSAAEWETRCDLAACYRAFVQFGWADRRVSMGNSNGRPFDGGSIDSILPTRREPTAG
jgi:hypothetical protein